MRPATKKRSPRVSFGLVAGAWLAGCGGGWWLGCAGSLSSKSRFFPAEHFLSGDRLQVARPALRHEGYHPPMAADPKPLCGARTRAGGRCQRHPMPNGRCRLHGGLSTGPRTEEGKLRSVVALIVGHTEWRRRQRAHPVDVLWPSSERHENEA